MVFVPMYVPEESMVIKVNENKFSDILENMKKNNKS
jgi:hypothetical protein